MVDEDTHYCPLGHRCESCGCESPRLTVVTRTVFGATLCLTMCPRCAASGQLPVIMVSTAEKLVQQHAGHVARAAKPAEYRPPRSGLTQPSPPPGR